MLSSMAILMALVVTLLTPVTGHMIMNTPYPYNYHTAPLVQVDPLGPSHPFPCQGLSTIEQTTPITAGSTQRVAFTGGAQHGGGSCQFSLTYEYPPPTDKSKWKTIYTIIGGCPVSAAGNLAPSAPDQDGRADSKQCGNDSGVECIREFNIPIPKGLPNGNATFSWTWFNKIGNREIYQVCSHVSIQGGAGEPGFFDSLPEMFVANVAGSCTTGLGVLNIPNPGKWGKVLEQPGADSNGNCAKAQGVPVFEEAGASPAPPAAAPPVAAPPSAAPPAPTTLVTMTRPASSAAPAPVASTVPGGGSTPCKPAPAPAPVAPNAPMRPTGGSVSGGGAQACSTNGEIICIGTSQFGICDHGKAVPQPLAAGTTCSGGKITRRRR